MRIWQVERRKRTRHLIELGGLIVKSGIVDLTGDDRATIFGALLWSADKLKSDQAERARALWAAKGKRAFEGDPATRNKTDRTAPAVRVDARQWDVSRATASRSDVRSISAGSGDYEILELPNSLHSME
jgi:phage gp16-like protein